MVHYHPFPLQSCYLLANPAEYSLLPTRENYAAMIQFWAKVPKYWRDAIDEAAGNSLGAQTIVENLLKSP